MRKPEPGKFDTRLAAIQRENGEVCIVAVSGLVLAFGLIALIARVAI